MSDNETIADIIAEMRRGTRLPGYWRSCDVNKILQYHADRLDAAHRRERGDCAKLREALKLCMDEMCNRCRDLASARGNPLPCLQGCEPVRKAKAALSVPPRNCDRPECATTKAAQDVWRKEDGGKTAYYEWLLATYKEGGNDGR